MKQLFTALFLISGSTCFAQGFQLQWANAFSGTAAVSVGPVAVDKSGNVYVPGSFSGTVDFDPSTGVSSLTADTALGMGTGFLAKYNAQGGLVFVRQLSAGIKAIAVDAGTNIWLTGMFRGNEDFDPGTGTAILSTGTAAASMYIAKYDAGGGYVNAFSFGSGSLAYRDVNAMAQDPSGNLYITGYFGGTSDFDPGSGTVNLTSTGNADIFVAKFSPAGALLHAFQLDANTSNTEEGVALAADAGGVFLGGRFNGTIDLDPGAATVSRNSIGVDGFIARYDHSGAFLFGNNYDGNVYALALDAASNLWVTGSIADSMDADLGPGKAMLYGTNNFDVYLVKYSSGGSYQQGRVFQSDSNYNPEEGIAINHKGSVYIYGRFEDTVDFNPGGTGGKVISSNAFDGYVMKYNSSSSFVTGFAIGSTGNTDRIRGMAIDQLGRIWISGNFTGVMDLDPGSGTTNVTSTPNAGGYIAQYKDAETENSFGISSYGGAQGLINVFGADNKVIVDFTALNKVDAEVKVLNVLGQTVAEARHSRNDMLRLQLPDAAAQMYVVTVRNGAALTSKKVWVK